MSPRTARVAGVAAPAAFVAAWVAGGARAGAAYSPIDDPISELAAAGASTRPLMTAGFLGFSAGMVVFATELRRRFPGGVWLAALVDVAGTVGVAATPLRAGVDGLHGIFAGTAYVGHVGVPLLAARSLWRRGGRPAAVASAITAAAAAAALLASATAPSAHGLYQRTGLTLVDIWFVVAALGSTEP